MNAARKPDWHDRDIPVLPPCPGDKYMLVHPRNGEFYMFLWDRDSVGEVLRTLGRFACNKDLAFDWKDAAELSLKIRNQAKG